jgi:hypothetical protein
MMTLIHEDWSSWKLDAVSVRRRGGADIGCLGGK